MNSGFYGFPNILGVFRATNLKVLGKAGATAGAGLAGGTTSGAPTSGQFDVGEAVIDQTGALWINTVAGSPGTWVKVGGTTSPLSTKGDVWVYGSADARLGVGSDNQVLTADSTQSLGVKWAATGAASLTTASANLGSDQTLTTSWADVVTVSLAAGTWLLWAGAEVEWISGGTPSPLMRVTDGTTVYGSAENTIGGSVGAILYAIASEPIVLGSTTTLKLQGVLPGTSTARCKANTIQSVSGSTSPKTTYLRGLKVA